MRTLRRRLSVRVELSLSHEISPISQALASCRNFIEWLDVSCGGDGRHQNVSPTTGGAAVTSALLGTLRSLNNEGVGEDDLVTPNAVLGALRYEKSCD